MNILDAFHQSVHGAPGGCEALAVRMGMSPQVLRNKANPNSTYNKPTLEDADRIMGLTGDHALLHALAANHGHVCVRSESTLVASDMAVLEMVAGSWAASGEVGKEVYATLADGIVEAQEVERVKAAVYRTVAGLHAVVARLEAMVEPSTATTQKGKRA